MKEGLEKNSTNSIKGNTEEKKVSYITSIETLTDSNVPVGYTKIIGGNLNHNVKGCLHKVYIAIKTAFASGDKVKGITDIKIYSDFDDIPTNYTICSTQLNEGNNGFKLYLCYKTESYPVDSVLKSLGTSNSEDRTEAESGVMIYNKNYKNWNRVPGVGKRTHGDTNANAGNKSDFVYIWYSKEKV